MPNGWSIARTPNSITLARDEKVFIYSTLNWPATSDRPMDNMVREYGNEIVYRITLRFIPRLQKNEYAGLRREWQACHIENKPGPTFSIEAWVKPRECYRARQPPLYYTNRYTIYVDQPNWWPELKLYPNAAAIESVRVHASLDRLFIRYEKAQRMVAKDLPQPRH